MHRRKQLIMMWKQSEKPSCSQDSSSKKTPNSPFPPTLKKPLLALLSSKLENNGKNSVNTKQAASDINNDPKKGSNNSKEVSTSLTNELNKLKVKSSRGESKIKDEKQRKLRVGIGKNEFENKESVGIRGKCRNKCRNKRNIPQI